MSYRLFAIFMLLSYVAWPQQEPARSPEAKIADELADSGEKNARAGAISPFSSKVESGALTGFIATLRMEKNQIPADAKAMTPEQANAKTYEIVLDLMEHSVDRQVGSTPDTKGTTSLAMKGAIPKVLGFAVQHGAITQQVNGNTVTFRATPAGVLKALAGVDAKAIFGVPTNASGQPITATCEWCNKFSAAISFDISQGANPGTLTASKQQVASWSARAELFNHRDPRRKEFIKDFQRLALMGYIGARENLQNVLNSSPEFKAWQTALVQKTMTDVDEPLRSGTITLDQAKARFATIVSAALEEQDKIKLPPEFDRELKNYADAIKPLLDQRNKIIDLANKGLLITADWTVTRDPNVPDLSTITGILENGLGPGRKYDLTINVAAAFFNSTPKAPVHQFHDFKATAQYDIPLGTLQSYGPFVFSLASRYEFVPNDTLSPGGTITGTSTTPMTAAPHGHLVVGQAKLTIPVKGSGVKIPFSISAANRTELIKEKDVRGNIGITFDLDAIFAQAGKNGK